MRPFVSKVSVEIHTWAETKGARIGVSILSPESVHRLGILVPSLVKSGEEEARRGTYPSGLVTGRMKKSNISRRGRYCGSVTRLFITKVTVAGLIHSRA